jgi:hypothetical protein
MTAIIDLKDRRWHRIPGSWPKSTSCVSWVGISLTSHSPGESTVTVASKETVMKRFIIPSGASMKVEMSPPTVLSRSEWPLKVQSSGGQVSLWLAIRDWQTSPEFKTRMK